MLFPLRRLWTRELTVNVCRTTQSYNCTVISYKFEVHKVISLYRGHTIAFPCEVTTIWCIINRRLNSIPVNLGSAPWCEDLIATDGQVTSHNDTDAGSLLDQRLHAAWTVVSSSFANRLTRSACVDPVTHWGLVL